MAVPKLFKMWICEILNIMISEGKLPFSLLMDLNGLIHRIAGHVFGYGKSLDFSNIPEPRKIEIRRKLASKTGFTELKNQFLNMIPEILTLIVIDKIQPTDILILCVDGIAPFAKANQQRSRRQKSGLERNSYDHGINSVPVNEKFDTAFLTGGLPFMDEISDRIHLWVTHNEKRLPHVIMVSDSRINGEGEHKMFAMLDEIKDKFFLTQNVQTDKNMDEEFRKQNHVVFGLDADIGLLCAMRDYNFLWMREMRKITHEEKVPDCVNISLLREDIVSHMLPPNYYPKRNKYVDFHIIRDFLTMLFFIGDDFVPGMFSLSFHIKFAIDKFFEAYQEYCNDNGEELKFISDDEGNINKFNFYMLLDKLTPKEKELYEFRQRVNLAEYTLANTQNNQSKEYYQLYNQVMEYRKSYKNDKFPNEMYYPAPILQYSYEEFNEKWKDVIVRPSIVGTIITQNPKIDMILANVLTPEVKQKEMQEICKNYLDMIQWNLKYYIGGNAMNNDYFKYPLSPSLGQLKEFLSTTYYEFPSCIRTLYDPIFTNTHMVVLLLNPNFSMPVIENFFGKGTERKNNYLNAISRCKYVSTIHPKSFDFFVQGKYTSEIDTKIPLLPPIILEDLLAVIPYQAKENKQHFLYQTYSGRSGVTHENPIGNFTWWKVLGTTKPKKSVGFGNDKVIEIVNRHGDEPQRSSLLTEREKMFFSFGGKKKQPVEEKSPEKKENTNSPKISNGSGRGHGSGGRGGRDGRGGRNEQSRGRGRGRSPGRGRGLHFNINDKMSIGKFRSLATFENEL